EPSESHCRGEMIIDDAIELGVPLDECRVAGSILNDLGAHDLFVEGLELGFQLLEPGQNLLLHD
ncbi:MAG: hypothetical protein IIC02_04100, partial [Planctomycetes bacterium]|nr:hypothetical protein [Planctomycetota bacterium]